MEFQKTRTSDRPQKRVRNEKKKSKTRPEARKHTKDPPLALFSVLCDFFEIFWIASKGPPSFVSIICNTMDVKKSRRVPLFTFFGTVTLFQNHIFCNFFGKFLKSPKGPPSIFFMFCNQLQFYRT